MKGMLDNYYTIAMVFAYNIQNMMVKHICIVTVALLLAVVTALAYYPFVLEVMRKLLHVSLTQVMSVAVRRAKGIQPGPIFVRLDHAQQAHQ